MPAPLNLEALGLGGIPTDVRRIRNLEFVDTAGHAAFLNRFAAMVERERFLGEIAPPFTVYGWWFAPRLRRRLGNVGPGNALATAEAFARQARDEQTRRLLLVHREQRFEGMAGRALAAGAAVAALVGGIAALAGASGPGAIVVGAVGFVAGLIFGFLPWAEWQAINDWTTLVNAMTPMERYLCLATYRELHVRMMTADRKMPFAPWELNDPGILDVRGGPQNLVYSSLHVVAVRDAWPEPETDRDRAAVGLYAAAVAGSEYRDPNKLLADVGAARDMGLLWSGPSAIYSDAQTRARMYLETGAPGRATHTKWVAQWISDWAGVTLGAIRAAATDPAAWVRSVRTLPDTLRGVRLPGGHSLDELSGLLDGAAQMPDINVQPMPPVFAYLAAEETAARLAAQP